MKKMFRQKINLFLVTISIGMLLMIPALMSCTPGNGPSPSAVLYGVTHYTANVSNTSYLYKIDTTNGTTTLIGDTGFKVDSIAYNSVTSKLYGITDGIAAGSNSQLIEINKKTGAGTLIADITVPGGTSVAVNNGWNSDYIGLIGGDPGATDYYAQSFIANVSSITRFGAVIQQAAAQGEIRIGIVSDNSSTPNYTAPLYMGSLITPTTTGTWYYESGLNIPVTPGNKYYVLYDAENNAGATGYDRIGVSNVCPIAGEGITFSNNEGVGEWINWSSYPLAIYIEGTPIFSNPAFNSSGELFAWNKADNSVCSIDLTTGVATCQATSGLTAVNFGLAFDNKDSLYLVNGGGGNVYTIDTATGAATSVGTLSGLTNGMAHRGDFHPQNGKYWGLDNTDVYTTARNLLVIDMKTLAVSQTISTLDSMQAIVFGY